MEKPKEVKHISKIRKANDYSYLTSIPKEVMTLLGLNEDAKVVYHVKQISTTQFECDITFQADGISIKDDKESAPAIDKPKEKTIEKKTTANNKNKTIKSDGLPLTIGQYLIQSVKNPYDSIEVRDTKADKRVTFIGVTKMEKDVKQSLIKDLSNCETIEQIEQTLFQYRP